MGAGRRLFARWNEKDRKKIKKVTCLSNREISMCWKKNEAGEMVTINKRVYLKMNCRAAQILIFFLKKNALKNALQSFTKKYN